MGTKKSGPWYESNLLWGPLGLAACIVLTVVAATKKDLRWLLWAAPPLFLFCFWIAIKRTKNTTLKWSVMAAFLLLVCIGSYATERWLRPQLEAPARIRILNVVAIPMSESRAPFPAITIYYDNAGGQVATGIVSRFAAGFGGPLSDEQCLTEQDKLLHWDGWKSAMSRRSQYEMHPGDAGELTSIPNAEGALAEQFRSNWDKVPAGTTVLHIFIAFKYFDPSGRVGITEDCFWFSGNFARHNCGRGRAYLQEN